MIIIYKNDNTNINNNQNNNNSLVVGALTLSLFKKLYTR